MITDYWQKQMDHGPTREYYETLRHILERICFNGSVLEIGTGWGISACAFIDSGIKTITSIDPNHDTPYGEEAKREIMHHIKNTNGEAPDVKLHTYKTRDFVQKIKPGKFSLVFIDGSHDYEDVKFDLEFASKVTSMILMDDFLHQNNYNPEDEKKRYGVARAVREFLNEHREAFCTIYQTSQNGFALIDLEV